MVAHIVCTDDPAEAMLFHSAAEALEKWRESVGIRLDGLPDRPLTSFTVEIA